MVVTRAVSSGNLDVIELQLCGIDQGAEPVQQGVKSKDEFSPHKTDYQNF